MAEYIEREALKNNLHFTKEGIFYHNGKAYMDLNIVDKIVLETPTADVVEVKHGEWIVEQNPDGTPYCLHCSVCDDDFSKIGITSYTDYCPYYGAKMDGGNKNETDNRFL